MPTIIELEPRVLERLVWSASGARPRRLPPDIAYKVKLVWWQAAHQHLHGVWQ